MTRVLQLITDRRRRGAQVFAMDLEEQLRGHGLQVSTVAVWEVATGNALDVPVLGGRRGWRTLSFLPRLVRLSRNYDVVVAHGASTLMAAALLRVIRRREPTIVYRQISDLTFWAGRGLRHVRTRWYLRHVDQVVALWGGARDVLATSFGVPSDRITVIPNGASSAHYRPPTLAERTSSRDGLDLTHDGTVVVYVGALAPEKRIDVLIEAMAELEAVLLVVGEGAERTRLETLAAEAAPGRVRFLGGVSDPRDVYWAGDIAALTSETESMPATLIEAGLCGLACVATAVDGIPEVVVDGQTGSLCAAEPRAVRRAIARALGNPSWGPAAVRHCRSQFSIDQVARRWAVAIDVAARTDTLLRRSSPPA